MEPEWPPIRRPMRTPRQPRPPSPRRLWLWAILVVILVVFFSSRTWLSYYVDGLWFESLGYAAVFWKSLGLQWGVFAVSGVATFLFVYGVFLIIKRTEFTADPHGQTIIVGGRVVKLPVESMMRLVALGGSLFIAASAAGVMMADWQTFALYWYAPRSAGFLDPIFGRPLNFYLFTLPALQTVSGWLLTMAVLSCLIAGFFLLINSGSWALEGRRTRFDMVPRRGISITFAFALLALAWRVYLGRFDLLTVDHTSFQWRHLHRCAHLPARPACGRCGTDLRSGNRGRKCLLVQPRSLAHHGGRSGDRVLHRPANHRMVRWELYRQAERVGSREAVYHLQRQADPAGLRSGRSIAATLPSGHEPRGRRPRE